MRLRVVARAVACAIPWAIRTAVAVAVASTTVFAASCSSTPISLTIDVITDWEAGIDFVTVEAEISKRPFEGAAAGEIRQESLRVTGTEPFLDGVRIAELDDVGAGRTFVRVWLRDASGRAIASRVLDVVLERPFAATLLLTRSCRDVECPAPAGAPELAECQGGECVDPRCSPSTPEFCPAPRCDADAECVTGLAWCTGEPVCRRGYCLCREPMPTLDAGTDAGTDAGPPDIDAGFDGGPACPTIDCANPACDGSPCDDGNACTSGDTCGAGACTGAAIGCDDGNGCTDNGCDPAIGCVFPANAAPCDDGNACTVGDACSGGACAGGGPLGCNDGNPCTDNNCNPASGCVFPNNGNSCNDGNPCTSGDSCGGGSCRGGGNAANGTSCGGRADVVCCGGDCVDTQSDNAHCGGCGVNCNAIGRTCAGTGDGGPACRGCTGNAECVSILNGAATCFDTASPPTFCQCQCPSDGVCAGAGCGAGMFCHDCPGHNYCSPTGGGC